MIKLQQELHDSFEKKYGSDYEASGLKKTQEIVDDWIITMWTFPIETLVLHLGEFFKQQLESPKYNPGSLFLFKSGTGRWVFS